MNIQLWEWDLDTVLIKGSLYCFVHIIALYDIIRIVYPDENINGDRAAIMSTHTYYWLGRFEYQLLI